MVERIEWVYVMKVRDEAEDGFSAGPQQVFVFRSREAARDYAAEELDCTIPVSNGVEYVGDWFTTPSRRVLRTRCEILVRRVSD